MIPSCRIKDMNLDQKLKWLQMAAASCRLVKQGDRVRWRNRK